MTDNMTFNVFINPLAFLEVDEPWALSNGKPPTLESIIGMLCSPGTDQSVDALIQRYRSISTEPNRLFAAPSQDDILEKLVWPLRNAKASYMVGNYLGTISLCGLVGEMAAILFFETSDIRLNNEEFNEEKQIEIFGSKFERLGQERRISILAGFNLISADLKQAFDVIKTRRRRYLHFYSQDYREISTHAIETYHAAVTVVVNLIGQDIKDGKIILRSGMRRYLEKEGLIQDDSSNKQT